MHAQREMNRVGRALAHGVFPAALAALAWAPCPARAQQTQPAAAASTAPAASAPAAATASPEEIAKLVKQLDDDQFANRQAASKRLEAIGVPAISALAKAAVGGSMEVTSRSIEVLGKFLDSPDESVRLPARVALENIAKSESATAADRAKQAIEARNPNKPAAGGFAPGVIRGGIRIAALNVAVAAGGAGGAQKVSVRNNDGVRDIDVEEPARKIKIHDDPAKAITVEVTETKDGKETTTKSEAKDADDLKKKAPEAFKLYKQYAQDNQGAAGIQLQIAGANNPGGGGMAVGPQPPANTPDARTRLATARLQAMARQLITLVQSEQVKDLPDEAKAAVKKQINDIKSQLAELEKQLSPPAATTKPAESK